MHSTRRQYIRLIVCFLMVSAIFCLYLNIASSQFPVGAIVTISSGESLSSVAKDLKAQHIIRSSILFQAIEVLSTGENKLIAGDYYFGKPISTYSVAQRIMRGKFELSPIRVTIPEGLSMKQTAALLAGKFKQFSSEEFMKSYPAMEGYLFPDTYFFMPNIKADGVIEAMNKNFNEKISALQDKINTFGKPESDVITMASILEDEAKTENDWQIIAGILWKRIKIGMPLQVDATNGIGPTYDTYTNKGLPPTPIGSPGIKTIEAAITPIETKYFYYISDKKGVIHYAVTFAEHTANIQKYLR